MDGILVVDKPKGMTSHDVVDFVRRRFGIKKAGHAGTLDPMATGVLVVLIGSLTKSSNLLMSDDKEYEGELTLGAISDTGDAWGKIEDSGRPVNFSSQKIGEVFNDFLGESEQSPPMYSAVKHEGKKLYELARRGISVQVKPRRVFIREIEILNIKLPAISFRVACSKGTYVRQLAVDIGKRLECGAYLSGLKRTRSGRFKISDAVSLDEIRGLRASDLERRLARL